MKKILLISLLCLAVVSCGKKEEVKEEVKEEAPAVEDKKAKEVE